MLMTDHDPTNGLTINRGTAGAALNGAFGAGAAEPTKLDYRRGYDFNGGQCIECSTGYAISSGLISVMLTTTGPLTGVSQSCFSWETVGGDRVCFFFSGGTNFTFYCGGALAGNQAIANRNDFGLETNRLNTIVGLYDGTNTNLYINGKFVSNAASPVAPVSTSHPMRIGARTNDSGDWDGEIFHVGMADFALTSYEVAHYHRLMMEEFHRI
jgi:hypothetical protein